MQRARLTPQEIEDIKWFKMTFQSRGRLRKYKEVHDPFLYLYPRVTFAEMGRIFGKSPKTIESLLKRI
jgi:hypothetical protein